MELNIQKYRALVDTESKTMKSTDLHSFVFEATGKYKLLDSFHKVVLKSVSGANTLKEYKSKMNESDFVGFEKDFSLNERGQIKHYNLTEVECNMIMASIDVNHLRLMAEVFVAVKNNLSIDPVDNFEKSVRMLKASKELAELFGLEGNQALLSANRATKNETGVDCLAKMDIKLISETKEQILTPTEIGKLLDPSLSGIAINKILQAFGFQEKVGKVWQPTEKGMEFAELLDTGKQHSDGTPVKQVKWKYSILKLIED